VLLIIKELVPLSFVEAPFFRKFVFEAKNLFQFAIKVGLERRFTT
jgi:hypothetical protein